LVRGHLLLAATFVARPWFVARFDWLDARGVGHADIDVIFRDFGLLATGLLAGLLVIPGVGLPRRSLNSIPAVMWYSGFSAGAMTVWTLWIGLVFHITYIALFTRQIDKGFRRRFSGTGP